MPAVSRTIEIKAPPSRVWRLMASEAGLRQWLSPNIEIDFEVGGGYSFVGPDGDTRISGQVLEIVPEGGFSLSWTEEGAGWTHPARLVIELEATAEGTKVSLVHDGFASIGKKGWESIREAYEKGADRHRVLEKLAEAVA